MNLTLITVRQNGTHWTEQCTTTKEVLGSMKRQREIAARYIEPKTNAPIRFILITSSEGDSWVQVYTTLGQVVGPPLALSDWDKHVKEVYSEEPKQSKLR